jgi:signal transduction histidine kinase
MEGDWLELEVADDGKGFDCSRDGEAGDRAARAAKGGNGIPSMRKRAEDIGGRFEITSTEGKGTAAILRVSIQKQPAK